MGQAKIRKATDPNYGKISNKMRGLIISPPIEISGNRILVKKSNLDEQDLRASLLYWDRLLYPQNRMIGFGTTNDEEFLINSGVMFKTTYDVGMGAGEEIILKTQAAALLDMQHREPGVWTLNGSENSVLVKGGLEPLYTGVTLQLVNAIPVPSTDTPLAEILEFKQRRRAELLALRAHFEGIAETIENSPDSEEELRKSLKYIDDSCSNLVKVTREWQSPIKLSSVSASFNLDFGKAFVTAAETWAAAEVFSFDLTSKAIASGGAALTSQFRVHSDISFRSLKKSKSPFRYIYNIQRDLQ